MAEDLLYQRFAEGAYQTILAASSRLPDDVTRALAAAHAREQEGPSRSALAFILENISLAREKSTPVCQDTGYPTFYVTLPARYDKARVKSALREQLAAATKDAVMRPNAVHSLTGKNSGNNTGELFPAVYFEECGGDRLEMKLLLKGGGSENVSAQYRLPHAPLKAGRDLEGVYRVVMHCVLEAQGFGCSPGVLGVAIGADRAQGYSLAKKQLLRGLDEKNTDPELARLEERILADSNRLGVGAMGFGGATTVLGVKAAAAHRHPASFFVTIAYGCWALRRKTMKFDGTGFEITD